MYGLGEETGKAILGVLALQGCQIRIFDGFANSIEERTIGAVEVTNDSQNIHIRLGLQFDEKGCWRMIYRTILLLEASQLVDHGSFTARQGLSDCSYSIKMEIIK